MTAVYSQSEMECRAIPLTIYESLFDDRSAAELDRDLGLFGALGRSRKSMGTGALGLVG